MLGLSFTNLSLAFIQLGAERFRAPEILFNPELIGQEYVGVHQVVVDSINRADLDLRKSLFSNILLSGGSTLTKGEWGPSILLFMVIFMAKSCVKRLWRPFIERGQEARRERNENKDLRSPRAEVLNMDRRVYPRRFEHLQESRPPSFFVPDITSLLPYNA